MLRQREGIADELVRRRKRRLDGAAPVHKGDDLGEAAEVDFGLPRHHATIGVEIKRKRRACDIVRCACERDDSFSGVVAMSGNRE